MNLGKLIFIAAIITGIHVGHLTSLGSENVILGCITDEIPYPPKPVFWWFATGIASFDTEPGRLTPLHFTFNECLSQPFFSIPCKRMLGILIDKGADIDAPSNVENQFPVLYLALMRCHKEGVEYAMANGADLNARPSPPSPYSEVSPERFLFSTSCDNKREIKAILDGEFDPVRLRHDPSVKVDWTRQDFLRPQQSK